MIRLLNLDERRLRAWERWKLMPALETYEYQDLLALRSLRKLAEQGIRADQLQRTFKSIRERLRDVKNPLTELKLFLDGKRVGVQAAGYRLDPRTGQLLFDFETRSVTALPATHVAAAAASEERRLKSEAERLFHLALEAEQAHAPAREIMAMYESALRANPALAPALVNIGTIYFNARCHRDAERYYARAVEADPNYPLAHFNLANLFDERGDRAGALKHYLRALELNASYADAHYNIALLYQGSGDRLRALRHWKTYLKLDPGSSWAQVARRELRKLREATIITGSRGA
ncbi:MAG: tetratricopeptide repeat protein [Bryobacteraceae bacterium]|nr:tetratricopeptide repeat protein [Bryobacteraceae bacterium]